MHVKSKTLTTSYKIQSKQQRFTKKLVDFIFVYLGKRTRDGSTRRRIQTADVKKNEIMLVRYKEKN